MGCIGPDTLRSRVGLQPGGDVGCGIGVFAAAAVAANDGSGRGVGLDAAALPARAEFTVRVDADVAELAGHGLCAADEGTATDDSGGHSGAEGNDEKIAAA